MASHCRNSTATTKPGTSPHDADSGLGKGEIHIDIQGANLLVSLNIDNGAAAEMTFLVLNRASLADSDFILQDHCGPLSCDQLCAAPQTFRPYLDIELRHFLTPISVLPSMETGELNDKAPHLPDRRPVVPGRRTGCWLR